MKTESKNHSHSKAVLILTEGLFSHVVDFSLWTVVYFSEMSLPQSRYGQIFRAAAAADQFLNQVNYEVIKSSIQNARKHGWIKIRRHSLPKITTEGRKRLAAILPQYDEERVWDGRMHLITYDIPEKKKRDREILRIYLRRMGCGLLQDSVWITPYNPIDTLRKFIVERHLGGTIIVSDMGTDGSIGEERLLELILRVYRLKELNNRYQFWLKKAKTVKDYDSGMLISYLAILQDDPQLPFSLLPSWWCGDKAYISVKSVMGRMLTQNYRR